MKLDKGVCREAMDLVEGDRGKDYGTPEEGLGRVAALWGAYLDRPLTVGDAARMMLLLKVARMGRWKKDTYIDAVAYTLIAEASDRHAP